MGVIMHDDIPYGGRVPTTDPEVLIRDTVGWTGKNILTYPYSETTKTDNKATFTDNGDGSITISSSAAETADYDFRFFGVWGLETAIIPPGDYIFDVNTENEDIRIFAIYNTTTLATGKNHIEIHAPNGITEMMVRVPNNIQLDSDITIYPMLRKASVLDPTYEPYHESVEQTLRDAEVIEGKNLNVYPYIISHTVNSGITIDIDSDGIITLNGTASGDSNQIIHHRQGYSEVDNHPIILPAGKYKVIGVGSDLSIELFKTVNGSRTSIVTVDSVDKYKTFELTETTQIGVLFYWLNGVTFSNRKFGIMIVNDSETDYTYEPYYIPLKDSKFDRAEQRVLGAKNLIDVRNDSATINGVTITRQPDNSYIVNGTCNAVATNIRIDQSSTNGTDNLKSYKGNYTLTLVDANGNFVPNTRIFVMQNTTWNYGLEAKADNNGKATGYMNIDNAFICLGFVNGATYDNVRLYPMLRLASDPDDAYVPYAKTNRELTELVTKPVDGTITSDFTISSDTFLKKVGKQVTMLLKLSQVTASSWTEIVAKVPIGFRPFGRIDFIGSSDGNLVTIGMYSNGNMQIGASISNAALTAMVTYFTND